MPFTRDCPANQYESGLILLHPEAVGGRPVVATVIVVVSEGVEAGHALDLEDRAGAGIVTMNVGHCHDRVTLVEGACDVGAVEGQVDSDGGLRTRSQCESSIDDAAERCAAIRIVRAARRDDVNVDAEGVSVIALIAHLDRDDVLGIRNAVA